MVPEGVEILQVNAILVLENPAPWAPMVGQLPWKNKGICCLAGIEVFGKPVAARIAGALRDRGVYTTVIQSAASLPAIRERGVEIIIGHDHDEDREIALAHAIRRLARRNEGTTLIARLGAYVELDIQSAIQAHMACRQTVTPICDNLGPLGYWFVDTKRLNTISPGSFLSECGDSELQGVPFVTDGYVNRLENAHDLRKLIIDGFLGRCDIAPQGAEIRPGVWVSGTAHLHKHVRLVAPVYVGRDTRVESTAIITRFSNLESHCHVGAGSVISHSSILPHTTVGKGLDISEAVVDGCELVDLDHNIALTIGDPNLIAEAASAKWHAPGLRPRTEKTRRESWQPEVDYSQYLTRAAGRFFEAFKGEA
jgi:carbonic anhydrase/acetyltransferase-like protein (isoleucine patch superfamily)